MRTEKQKRDKLYGGNRVKNLEERKNTTIDESDYISNIDNKEEVTPGLVIN